ncbi:MAG: hypothetical protein IJH20_03460 [Bacilli bacterium]|nr:hypothetical protein [Bacilli bacterium]
MENTNKKSGKGLVITLVIFMLAFAACAALLFTGVVKSPMVKEKDCKETKCDTTTKNDTKKTDTKTSTTADERYKEYISNLAASIKENSKFEEDPMTQGLVGIFFESYKNEVFGSEVKYYSVELTKDLELVYSYGDTKRQKVADNVVSYYRIHVGNGDSYRFYYITTDGTIHSVNLEETIYLGKTLDVKDLEYKNIVEVRQGSTVAGFPVFVDIEGKIFKN